MFALIMIVIGVIALAAAVAAVRRHSRRRQLRQRFGAEYHRLVDDRQSKRIAESELIMRQRHVSELGIRPLAPWQRRRYAAAWAAVLEKFADVPDHAVMDAQYLVCAILAGRGYPLMHREQVISDLSVQHASLLGHFRAACELADHVGAGMAPMLDMRQAMVHYRVLVAELLAPPADQQHAAQLSGRAAALPTQRTRRSG